MARCLIGALAIYVASTTSRGRPELVEMRAETRSSGPLMILSQGAGVERWPNTLLVTCCIAQHWF